jgi:predicted GH43/DUF377 family glycosyl hydrolase
MAYEKTTLARMTRVGLNESSNPVIACGTGSDSDKYIREIGNVLYESTEITRKYKIVYTGYNVDKNTDEKIHYAYSEDGKTWTKSSSNPVVSARRAEDPFVVKSGGTYYLFAEDKEAGGNNKIRRWHSSDCETWSDDGQLTGIGDGQSPTVWIEGSTWYMLYERYPANADIALATSADGLAWTDDASNPVMEKTDTHCDWVSGDIVPDDVIKQNSVYYMFYHGHDGTVFRSGIATSTNLTNWVDSSQSPLEPDESTANKMVTASICYDTESSVFYWPRLGVDEDNLGIYRGYPISRPDVKGTELPELTTVAGEDLLFIIDDPSGVPITCYITKTNFLSGLISDTEYGNSWDGVIDVAPSKNAVYDKFKEGSFDNFKVGTQTIESNPWNAITVGGSAGYNFTLYDITNAEPWISAYRNLGVYLYHNGSRRLATAAEGVEFTNSTPYDIITTIGPQTIDAGDWHAIQISGAANFTLYDKDNSKAMLGAYREEGIRLYYNGSAKFDTVTGGTKVTGYTEYSNLSVTMKIGPQTVDAGTWHAIQISGAANFTVYDADNSKAMIGAYRAAGVFLYYSGVKKFETTNTGITVQGSCSGCDYVFEEEYDLMSLDALRTYITKNECLPNMTINKGYDIDLDKLRQESVEKIEEGMLYTLQLHNRLLAVENHLNMQGA